jgi:hypothetical protein
MVIAVRGVWKLMKRILGIIILSFVFFTAGSIFGTGGIDTKPTIESLQTETIEVGYTTIIDFWTAFKQIEVFVMASQENIETTFNHFREEQMKIAVAGLVNYKSGNTRQLNIHSLDIQSVQIYEQGTPVANQKTDFQANHEPLDNSTLITVRTADTSMDPEQLN